MWSKVIQRLKLYRNIRFFKYVYLNYFCKNVIRTDQSHIIPYKNAVLDLDASSKIYIGGGDLEIGCDRLKGSKAETLIRLRENAVWSNHGGCRISYGATIEVLQHGLLDTQFFTVNSNSVMIAANRIQLGRDVMIARNVIIYDSDHHTITNGQNKVSNPDQPICIGDHVWLVTNVTVLKGTTIGNDCLIGSNSIVRGNIPANTLYQTAGTPKLRENYGNWDRQHPAIGDN